MTDKQTYSATTAQNIGVTSLVGVDNPNDQLGFVAKGTGCGSAAMLTTGALPASDGNVVVDFTGVTGELDVCVCDATISGTGTSCDASTPTDWAQASGGAAFVGQSKKCLCVLICHQNTQCSSVCDCCSSFELVAHRI